MAIPITCVPRSIYSAVRDPEAEVDTRQPHSLLTHQKLWMPHLPDSLGDFTRIFWRQGVVRKGVFRAWHLHRALAYLRGDQNVECK